MTANTMSFRRGGSAAEEAEKEANASSGGGRRSADYFSLRNDTDSTVIRLLTDHDDWIWVEQHSFVPTKAAPEGAENWPKSMTAVCRKDEAFAGHYNDCYIDDKKLKNIFGKLASSRIRIWALAVERELVRGDGSEALGGPSMKDQVLGVRDKVDDIDELDAEGKPTGVKLHYPRIIIVNQPMKGFFANLKALHGLYGTLCDRDFSVTREGTGTDTNYKIVPIDPLPDLKPGTPAWDKYLQAAQEREINLEAIVAEKASDAYYARFFDPSKHVDKDGNVTAAPAPGTGPVNIPAATGGTAQALPQDLRDRIRNLGSTPASDAPPY
ncbi:hypothetical protein [Streptomyces sp. NPDC059761]|uniref:hypothetical protein n=1 Tax=Streptomyces sp. NPDC059761 TaxID=3346937 RepID=UPI0036463172